MNSIETRIMIVVCIAVMLCGCATVKLPKQDVVEIFKMCGDESLIAINQNQIASCADSESLIYTLNRRSSLKNSDTSMHFVVSYSLNFGSSVYFSDEKGLRRRINIDQNSSIVLIDSLKNSDRLYLAGSTSLYGNCITGAKSRLLGWDKSFDLKGVFETGIYDEAPFNYFHKVDPVSNTLDDSAIAFISEAFAKSDSITFSFKNVMCDEDESCLEAKMRHSKYSMLAVTISNKPKLDSVLDIIRNSGPFRSPDSMKCIGRAAPFCAITFHSALNFPEVIFRYNRQYLSIGVKSGVASRNIVNILFPFIMTSQADSARG